MLLKTCSKTVGFLSKKKKLKNVILIITCGVTLIFLLVTFLITPYVGHSYIMTPGSSVTGRSRDIGFHILNRSEVRKSRIGNKYPDRGINTGNIPWEIPNNITSAIRCSVSGKINIRTKEFTFQLFPERSIYVYSAFLDVRAASNRTIRIIAISPLITESFYCQLFYPDGAIYSVPGYAAELFLRGQKQTQSRFKYMSRLFLCKEPIGMDPVAISLTHIPCMKEPTHALKLHVRGNVREEEIPNKILTCVKLLYNFKAPHKLIEFLEYQKLVGVDHVNIFDLEVPSAEVLNVIKYYQKTAMLTLQPWKLPMASSLKVEDGGAIRVHGQHAQIQDCLYRNMHKYKYIVVLDTDEFIISHKSDLYTYKDIMKYLDIKTNNPTSSFVFANAHFCLSNKEMVFDNPRLLLTKKLRRNPLSSFRERCKSIINPRRVLMMGVHFVTKPYPGFQRFRHVPPSVAFMHHYRKTNIGKCQIKDKTALKYDNRLNSNVNKVCDQLNIVRI